VCVQISSTPDCVVFTCEVFLQRQTSKRLSGGGGGKVMSWEGCGRPGRCASAGADAADKQQSLR
jgi:hypothetical protein